jgi:hypothetical protein
MEALGKSARRTGTLHALGYLALALFLGLWAAREARSACGGELIPPLDDTYIYLQYARSAAAGHPFQYQPGAPPTRGATSLLYPFILAPWARFLDRGALIWAAWGLGVLFWALTALAVDRWAARRLGPRAGPTAGLLTLLSGHVLWGAVSGMDIALYGLALAGAVAAVPWYQDAPDARSGARRLAVLFLWLLFVGTARPEGILIAGVIALCTALARSAPNSARARWSLVLAPALAAAITFGVDLMALGHPGSNTLAAKAVWSTQRPDVRAALLARLPWVFGQIVMPLFTDFGSAAFKFGTQWILRGLLMVGGAAGLISALFARRRGLGGRTLVLVLLAGCLSGLIPVGFNSHHHRYQIPYVPLVLLLVVTGWWRLAGLLRGRWARLRLVPLVLLGVLLLPGLHRFLRMTGENAGNIHDQQVAMGRWIDANLPADAIVGINDAGAIAYYGKRRVVDLVGLVTNGSALPDRAGEASLFEWLSDLPPDERPGYFAVYPTWFPYLHHTTLLGKRLTHFTLLNNTICGAATMGLYVADWSAADPSDRLLQRRDLVETWGFRIADDVDVADLRSQKAHRYSAFDTWDDTLREFPVAGDDRITVIDGGLQPTRGERFTLRAIPHRPGVLVLRTESFRTFRLGVRVNGVDQGPWTIPQATLVWTEAMFQLPDSVFTGDSAAFEIRSLKGPDSPYASFHYWLLQ